MKKILKHITKYWNAMQKRLHESSTVNLSKTSTTLTPNALKQSKLNILSVFHLCPFSFFLNCFLYYMGHTLDTVISGN